MARTTTSKRGNTKTNSSKASRGTGQAKMRATAKPRAAAARTSKVSTRATAVKAVSNKAKDVQKVRRNVLAIGNLLAVSLVLYLGLAVAAGFLMKPLAIPVTLTHLAKDELLSQTQTVLVPANRTLFDVELRWVLVALLAFSAVLPLLYLTKLKVFYAERIAKRRVIGLRWFDLAVSGTLMVETIALLVGYSDLFVLKLLGALIGTTCALGWMAERQNETAGTRRWSAFNLSLFTGVMPWVAIGAAKLGTLVYGDVRSPWYVYALCAAALAGFILLALNQFNEHRRFKSWAEYAVVERNYILTSVLTKTAFAVILIVGLAK